MTVYRFPIAITSITIYLEGLPRSWRKIASREYGCSILAAEGVLERSAPELESSASGQCGQFGGPGSRHPGKSAVRS
jgi:hypothetical protein